VTRARTPSRARRPPSRSPRRDRGPAVDLAVRDGVVWITLARPASRNRLDAEVMSALDEACAAAEDEDAAQVVVLAARGREFSAGLPPGRRWPEAAWRDGVEAVARVTKPVIAALQGDAHGWGFALALACDLRIASARAVFSLPEVEAGYLPGGGAIHRLARMAGPSRTMEMALLGSRVAAPRAESWGIVSAVVEPSRLLSTVEETARALARRAPVALRLAKEAVTKGLDLSLAEGIRLEQDLYVLLQTTEDRREGVRAFLERRAPHFRGR
jgi:enoyl-CoA hydratase/carnithine racemase